MGENTEVLYSKTAAELPQNRSSVNRQRPQPLPSGGRQDTDVISSKFPFKARVRRDISNPHEVVVAAQPSDAQQHEHEKKYLTVNIKKGTNSEVAWTKDNFKIPSVNAKASGRSNNPQPRWHPLLLLMSTEEPFLKKPNTTPKKAIKAEAPPSGFPPIHNRFGAFEFFDDILPLISESEENIDVNRKTRQSESRKVGIQKSAPVFSYGQDEFEVITLDNGSNLKRPDSNKLNNEVRKILTESPFAMESAKNNNYPGVHEIKPHGLILTHSDTNTIKTKKDSLAENVINKTLQSKNQSMNLRNETGNVLNALRNSKRIIVNVSMETEDKEKDVKASPFLRPVEEQIPPWKYLTRIPKISKTSQPVSNFSPVPTAVTSTTRIGYFVGGQCECSCPCLDLGWNDETSLSSMDPYESVKLLDTSSEASKFEKYSAENISHITSPVGFTNFTSTSSITESTFEYTTDSSNASFITDENSGTTGYSEMDEIVTTTDMTFPSTDSTLTSESTLITETGLYESSSVSESTESSILNQACPTVTPPPPMILILEGENTVF